MPNANTRVIGRHCLPIIRVLAFTAYLQLAIVRYPHLLMRPLSLGPPHISGRPPMAAIRNKRMYAVKVGPSATPSRCDRSEYSFCVAQGTARVTDRQRQSACSQRMSCSTYFVSIKRITTNPTLSGNGTYLCTYVKDGDSSYSRHHSVSTCEFSAHPEISSGRIWVSGQHYPSVSILIAIPIGGMATMHQVKIISLLYSGMSIVCAMSDLA